MKRLYDDVFLQTWTHGASREYWIVTHQGIAIRPVADTSTRVHLHAVQEREKALIAARRTTLSLEDTGLQTVESTRPWMERTRWAITYEEVSRELLRCLSEMPADFYYEGDHLLGRHANADLASPQNDERKIRTLMDGVDLMLDRCEETMRHTGRPILPCFPEPFKFLGRQASRKRHRLSFKRFTAFYL
jgi:hypothetical protein